ncbi:MAG: aspartate aminotransferase family protein [Bacteroidota bacterium]|nr:aspartate aminotransferase family protein [Bacteroidota bacterium]
MTSSIIPLYKQTDKVIIKAKDCYIYDSNNKQYIDFESGDWAANLGHSNERISQILKNQSELLIHDGLRFRNIQSEELSNKLLEKLSFKDGKSTFLNSGSEAVNLAITIAKNLTRRNKILKMDCSFLSAYGHGQISPDNSNLESISTDNIDSISQINFQEIAAFIFEPGNAWGLIKYPTNKFISSIASAIKQNGGLLIANEVTTGFGRTGKWFGFQHYDYKPDIVSVGKGLGNGYPISGVSITKEIADLFDGSPFRYAQSHQNDPLGCAVGLEVISIFDNDRLIEKSYKTGQYFNEHLLKLQANHKEKIYEIRARGLMISLVFHSCINTENIYLQLIDHGMLVGQKDNVLRFMPPLIIEEFHIDKLISTIDKIITGS